MTSNGISNASDALTAYTKSCHVVSGENGELIRELLTMNHKLAVLMKMLLSQRTQEPNLCLTVL